ncbi:hypothetical protein F2Q69_00054725 [Brassica cretica]|uniref:Uncharacterized protein n=1 Tax=Brassica cretica TaxID=69181 RepID=A0A8S9N209_BRACR|nr:hypothetical protein F2Q69_00054725 [Brassica cretica]
MSVYEGSKGDEVVSLGKRLLPARSGEAPFSFRRGPVKRRSVSGVIPFGGIGVGSCDACHASFKTLSSFLVGMYPLQPRWFPPSSEGFLLPLPFFHLASSVTSTPFQDIKALAKLFDF